MITASSLGYPRTALIFLNRPRVVALLFRLDANVGIARQNGRGPAHKFGSGGAGREESLKKPHACHRPSRPDRRDLPLPRQRPDPGAAQPRRAQARPDAAGRPPLRHRERPLRLRPGRAEMAAETAFPDADAGRMAGRAAHPFRRCEQRPLDQPQRPDRGPGQSGDARGPARQSRTSSPPTFAGQIKGPPKVLESPGHSFSDVARKVVSIINLASVRAIENMVGAPVHPLRFRANLYVEGWPAWHEFDLLDRTLAIGDVRLKVVKRIVRCAAVNVDPDTAAARPRHPAGAAAPARPCRLRDLCRGDRRAARSAPTIRSRRNSRSCCSSTPGPIHVIATPHKSSYPAKAGRSTLRPIDFITDSLRYWIVRLRGR